ncbi:MBL fold metallo-hydrolase [Chloroflexota bacterium]
MLRVVNHRPQPYPNNLTTPLIGSCLEIKTPELNLLCDAGIFFPADREFIDVLATKKVWQAGIDHPVLTAECYHCLLSHGHTDHYAGLYALKSDTLVEVYAGDLTWRVFNETASLLETISRGKHTRPNVHHVGTFQHGRPLAIDGCRVTPLIVRHSIPDTWAFVIEHSGTRLLYPPEFMDRFWSSEPDLIRDIDIAVIGYMPDIEPGDSRFPDKDDALIRGKWEGLVFYVITGENLESIENCLQHFYGIRFVSPYIRDFFTLLPEHMREDFPLIGDAETLDIEHALTAVGLVACNFTELTSYLDALNNRLDKLYIVSNDFSLSTIASVYVRRKKGRLLPSILELQKKGQFADAFQSAHGSQRLVRELLAHLLNSRERIIVMVTHATDATSLRDEFGARIEFRDQYSI